MVDVLCIGQYDKVGKFSSNQWKCFIELCKEECNRVIVYTQKSYRMICEEFPFYCNISTLEKPDTDLDVYAYKIYVTNSWFWDYIENCNYDIDESNNISHIFFYHYEKYIASLEIVDYENYVLLEEDIAYRDKLLENKAMVYENVQLCSKGEADIEGILQEESWRPLGESLVEPGNESRFVESVEDKIINIIFF